MFQKFEKWHGCKNDFIVTWLTEADGDVVLGSLRRQAPTLCNRDGSGIGADGILVLHSKLRTTLIPDRLTIINSDGSLAKNCGNGIRCAAGSIRRHFLEERNGDDFPEALELSVDGTEIICRFLDESSQPDQVFVAVDMGVPTLGTANSWHAQAKKEIQQLASELHVPALIDGFDTCQIGNSHISLLLDEADRDLLLKLGPRLQNSPHWDGINVHVCRIEEMTSEDQAMAKKHLGGRISELYQAYAWERGAGETQACGSGACAIAASVLRTGLLKRDEWVAIDMPGGRLFCRQDHPSSPVTLAGPAKFVFSGTVEI